MTALLFIVVVGWGILLDRFVKLARIEVGAGKDVRGASALGFWSWIPIVCIAGICSPGIFLGKDIVHKLEEKGRKGVWYSRIRLGASAYLLFLLGIPMVGALAVHP